VLLTDFLLFDNVDNDLVVDTPAMLAGIAANAGSRVLFDRGADVSHFRYSPPGHPHCLARLARHAEADELDMFHPLPTVSRTCERWERAASRGADDPARPVVVVLRA